MARQVWSGDGHFGAAQRVPVRRVPCVSKERAAPPTVRFMSGDVGGDGERGCSVREELTSGSGQVDPELCAVSSEKGRRPPFLQDVTRYTCHLESTHI